MLSRVARVAQRSCSSGGSRGISTVGVVGMGSMGHGVAQLCASSGYDVVAIEQNQESLDKGIKGGCAQPTPSRLRPTHTLR